MKKTVAVIVLCWVSALLPAKADAYSLLGGETLRIDEIAIHGGIGYPDLTFSYHIPITNNLELAPRFTFFYGSENFHVPFVGDTLTCMLRYAFIKGQFSLSLHVDFGLILIYHPGGFGLGLRLGGPSVLVDYKVTPRVNLVGGFLMPIAFLFLQNGHSRFGAQIPFVFRVGSEFALTSDVNLFAHIDVGPQVWTGGGFSAVSVYFRANVGAQYKF